MCSHNAFLCTVIYGYALDTNICTNSEEIFRKRHFYTGKILQISEKFSEYVFSFKGKEHSKDTCKPGKIYTKFLPVWSHLQTKFSAWLNSIRKYNTTAVLASVYNCLLRKPILHHNVFLWTSTRRGCMVIKSSQHSFRLAVEMFFLSVGGCVNSQNNVWCGA